MYRFEELTEETRQAMLMEFEAEESIGSPYRSQYLSPTELRVYPRIMEEAMCTGTEVSLAADLSKQEYWLQTGVYYRSGKPYQRRINFQGAARRLAISEFNTWYVRGLARRLLDEGTVRYEVYRAESAQEPRDECLMHEGAQYEVQDIYDGHRVRYWPPPGNPTVLSIPVGPNCHHTIRRCMAGQP